MSEKTITTCDCGCKKRAMERKTGDWFVLRQSFGFPPNKNPTIEGTLHFSSLDCLQTWVTHTSKK